MGGLADILTYTQGTVSASIETSSPLVGARSLKIGPGSSSTYQMQVARLAAVSQGFLGGRMRAIMKNNNFSVLEQGLVFCCSGDVTGATGACYAIAHLINTGLSPAHREFLYKTSTGLDNLAALYQVNGAITNGNAYAVEVSWAYHPELFEGLLIEYRRGALGDTSFDSLSHQFAWIDEAPLIDAQTEGLYVKSTVNGTSNFAHFDAWTTERLALDEAPFLRWEKFKASGITQRIRLEPINLQGSTVHPGGIAQGRYSLIIEAGSTANKGAAFINRAQVPAALTAGHIVARVTFVSGGGNVQSGGFVIMPTQRNVQSGGSFYAVGCQYDISAGSRRLGVRKMTAGLAPGTVLSTGTTDFPSGSAFWLEIYWEALGTDTRIDIYAGTAADYSDRAMELSYTETTTGLQTAAGLGFYALNISSGPTMKFDQITIEQFGGF